MKEINRRTPELALYGGRAKTRMYIHISLRRIYFTAAVSRLCEMEVGLYVNDDVDGFKLTPIKQKNALQITNSGLVNMILKSVGIKDEKRFALERTNTMIDKCPVFKLSFDNVPTVIR